MNTKTKEKRSNIWSVIVASSMGTLIEWYDFYIFGSLAVVLSTKFFPADNPTAAFLSTLATFAAGFVVRPFGALFFGRLGDIIGRKYTFMVTLLLMGGATFIIGCVPSFETIGYAAPIIVLTMRLLQGLALGGEYGGAATYVAEHSPQGQRGFWTSWIQTTATVGLFVSLLVIWFTRSALTPEEFDSWGWRVPFWISIFMVYISYIIRKNMSESPLFAKAKSEGKTSSNPLKESFGNKTNLKFVLLALFGATMGQGVVWYTGQFYAMSFIERVMSVDPNQTIVILVTALFCGTPFFILFGWLSDKVGRKAILMSGMLIAVLAYRPIYKTMYQATNIEHKTEIVEKTTFSTDVKTHHVTEHDSIYTTTKHFTDGTVWTQTVTSHLDHAGVVKMKTTSDGKQVRDEISKINIQICSSDQWFLTFLVFLQVLFVTMVYGPIAAFLVELFPIAIRYTSMSLPYHIGNGIFGGLLPAVSTYFVTNAIAQNHPEFYLQGLWYPIIVGAVCFLVGLIYINKKFTSRYKD